MENDSFVIAKELSSLNGKDYISSSDLDFQQVSSLLVLASKLKRNNRRIDLGNRTLGLIFKKASTRTRVSFQVAMARLGGQVVELNVETSQIKRGEPVKDTARVLSRYCDAIAIRTYDHEEIVDYSNWASVPVINALTDLEHPCQALADFLTLKEEFGSLNGLTLAYIGDGNNVANSLMLSGAILGVNIQIACPKGYEPDSTIVQKARLLAEDRSFVNVSNNPFDAVQGVNAIYTDVWASMGQEKEKQNRQELFENFTVNQKLLFEADKKAIVLHCLPAHRGEEITDEVIEGKNSRIFDQAENRVHVQQALLAGLLGGL